MQIAPSIRLYNHEDYHLVVELLEQLQETENAVEPNRLLGKETAIKYFDNIKTALSLTEGTIYVAIINEKVIGLLIIFIEENDIVEIPGRNIYISDIVVDSAFRQQGIGTLLMNTAESYAKENNISELRICVLKQNVSALKLYYKSGFYEREVCLAKYI